MKLSSFVHTQIATKSAVVYNI